MHNFVIQALAAVWEAYYEYADREDLTVDEKNTKSWLYDAACLLDILSHDKRLLEIYDDYYRNCMNLPWKVSENYAQLDRSKIDYSHLFNLWADFNKGEAAEDTGGIIEKKQLGSIDALSFTAFCGGWEEALKEKEEE